MKAAFVDDDEEFVAIPKKHLSRAARELGITCNVWNAFDFLYPLCHAALGWIERIRLGLEAARERPGADTSGGAGILPGVSGCFP